MSAWQFQLLGVIGAAALLAAVRLLAGSSVRPLAAALLIAALIYVGFALANDGSASQLLVEATGVIAYGTLAWLGVTRSPAWLAAGWALHPAWDVGLHLLGPSAGTAPAWYAHLCLGFDLAIAGYLLFHLRARRSTAH